MQKNFKVWIKSSTDQIHNIAVQGPKSRDILKKFVWTPLTQPKLEEIDWFRFTVGRIGDLNGPPIMVSRTGYTGELGYEIYVAPQFQLKLFEEIELHGKELSLKLYGARALMALRLEKNWGAWSLDFRPDFTAAESGLDAFIDWNKDFVGKEACLVEKNRELKRNLLL